MNGGRSARFLPPRRGLSSWTVCVLFLAVVPACGCERRSGTVPAGDSAQTSASSSARAATSDTAAVTTPDSTRATARADSTPPQRDTATTAARKTRPKKAAKKPVTPKPAAAAPAAGTDTTTASAGQTGDTAKGAPTPTSEANAPLRDQYHRAPLDTVPQIVYTGWKQFNLNCARCHGEDVQGTTIAPHLIVSLRPEGPINTKEIFVQTVCAGRLAKGMPSWCALGMEIPTIEAIYAYVKGRSDSKIHPGRPAVKSGG